MSAYIIYTTKGLYTPKERRMYIIRLMTIFISGLYNPYFPPYCMIQTGVSYGLVAPRLLAAVEAIQFSPTVSHVALCSKNVQFLVFISWPW